MICFGYLAAYGVLRFVNDFFRGDAEPFPGFALTTAQVLSLAAILASAIGWATLHRRRPLPQEVR